MNGKNVLNLNKGLKATYNKGEIQDYLPVQLRKLS